MPVKPILAASDAELAAAIEENLFALFRAMATLPGSELVESERLSYHDTFPVAPMFKGVWRARLETSEMDAAIQQMIDWFTARRAPLITWWFNQYTPSSLIAKLQAQGFELDYIAPGMALDLDTIPTPLPLPDGLTIVDAVDARTLDDWSDVLYATYAEYGMPEASTRVWAAATLAWGANAPWRMYVGYLEGKPVAINILFRAYPNKGYTERYDETKTDSTKTETNAGAHSQ